MPNTLASPPPSSTTGAGAQKRKAKETLQAGTERRSRRTARQNLSIDRSANEAKSPKHNHQPAAGFSPRCTRGAGGTDVRVLYPVEVRRTDWMMKR